MELLGLCKIPVSNEVGPGVWDIHSPRVPEASEMRIAPPGVNRSADRKPLGQSRLRFENPCLGRSYPLAQEHGQAAATLRRNSRRIFAIPPRGGRKSRSESCHRGVPCRDQLSTGSIPYLCDEGFAEILARVSEVFRCPLALSGVHQNRPPGTCRHLPPCHNLSGLLQESGRFLGLP